METKYKSYLCDQWKSKGSCSYQRTCEFAHGVDEIIEHYPKYKLQVCSNEKTSDKCKYGNRCHFVHRDDVNDSQLRERAVSAILDYLKSIQTSQVKAQSNYILITYCLAVIECVPPNFAKMVDPNYQYTVKKQPQRKKKAFNLQFHLDEVDYYFGSKLSNRLPVFKSIYKGPKV